MECFDVAIVGYGPTGATLAHLLGQCGVSVVILEREGNAYHLPRAVHLDAEVMRTLQWAGIADALEPKTAPHPGMRFVGADGRLLLDWPRPQGQGPQGWRANYRFHQPDLEKLLRDHMAERETVSVRTRCDVVSLKERKDGVELRYEDRRNGRTCRVSAKYVVGCDGARSLVRGVIRAGMEDFGFHERWLVIDAILNREKPELGDHSVQYCVPERPATYVRCPGLRRRWEITVRPEEDANEIARPARVWELLSRWLTPDEAELERSVVYTFHSLVAKSWRKGRLLLAGDACHQTPPFMGQGMCAGIRDVANLYWKLALICQGSITATAAERLLDSYESERKPNAREYIATAVRLGGLINTCGTQEALRAAFPSADGAARMESIAPPLGKGLGTGDKAGRLFGQPRLSGGALMDDVHPHRFVVVADADLVDQLSAPEGTAIVSTTASADAAEHLAQVGARAVILRPDRYILGAADTAEELTQLLSDRLPDPVAA
ncbi:bifunctional 3-(3-hydroxy-phenyl)propionate/3-hydroxycinnamic acid hydroxylase [Hoeflea poritis]|uniref:Bifunctional 3-(3-hydroxy-phenyl)propionate/3-hydroxycinnamic acid hydroxylase n=1 Tax=Hoeflea poritis TaxID=2993659 RepID=A0ABT4VPP8_9HYPH|nr:bifunctional 3-(3-hydroxy-phenyl)propionate/3-hydroxycinnamic acid hydroxylase [Hoeflea poritis]MDA4846594.1 bifunctional 3-(3-hydroxy-phenyl)propionate/3-hydroxycinnamic acid hydroxylase [Hoeflea poritis]